MKKILKNKVLTITICLVFVVAIIAILIIRSYIYKKCAKEAQVIYNQVHELYYFGGNIEFNSNENNERIFIEENNKKYYQISNYEESVKKYFTQSKLQDVNKDLNIINKDNNYYMKDIGRGISNYYETTIISKKIRSNERIFIAKSKFCKIDYQVSYGDHCEGKNEYYIEKKFVLKKFNKEWKVDEYTSIFEFDKEIK